MRKRSWAVAAAAWFAVGCGARNAIFEPSPPDDREPKALPSPDAGAVDAGPRPLWAGCPEDAIGTPPGRGVSVVAEVRAPLSTERMGWEIMEEPVERSASISHSPNRRVAIFTPREVGAYRLRFLVEDIAGQVATCEATVVAVVGPPVALCPSEVVRGAIGRTIPVRASAVDDRDGLNHRFEVLDAPPGAEVTLRPAVSARPETAMVTDRVGRHRIRFIAIDRDGLTDSCVLEVQVTGPPEVVCPPGPIEAPTRRPHTLNAAARDDLGLAERSWAVLARPERSTAEPIPADRDVTQFTPDRRGAYRLRYRVVDVEGFEASCEVEVIGTPTPPDVTCPSELSAPPLNQVTVAASGADDGEIVSWRWEVEAPRGSAADAPSPADRPTTRFRPDIAGAYRLRVRAVDDDGMEGSCTTLLRAGNLDGLRVEMFWDTDRSDIDLHLLNPRATRWWSGDDCYFTNCVAGDDNPPRLEWGAAGEGDNPRLDIDDTNGFGPENTNIRTPAPGVYRVGVHYWGGIGPTQHNVTVQIYCADSDTVPRQVFGPVQLNRRGTDFWRVADVEIRADGGCRITDLARPTGEPWIGERQDSERRR